VVSFTVPSVTGCYEQFYLKVADAMRTGAPPPVDPADGLRVIKVIEAAKISSDTKSVCKIE
jgi:predicted dehydrogenase